MNSTVVAISSLIILSVGYKFYGGFMEKFWEVDPERKTPANEINDGIDYVPAKHWTILFGHHFASIAGAAPIIGPVIACIYWGWLGGLIWIVFGTLFMGAVHDFSSLMVSVRNGGKTIDHIFDETVGKRFRMVFSLLLWLLLILVVAIFAAAGGMTLAVKPQIVIPALGIIPIAVIVGYLIYRTSVSQAAATVIGIAALSGLLVLGYNLPVIIASDAATAGKIWTIVLLVYAYAASILPVNILLQPRDYISTFLLFFGLLIGYAGIFISHPPMRAPAFVAIGSPEGPLWPMMFVTIACGAISGFHSIVASGTTAKQISSEKDIKKIGYGGMVVEAALAVLAVIAVAAGLHWNPGSEGPVYSEMFKKGQIVAFSEGFGQLTLPILGGLGTLVAATILNAFIITTLDTATRITRYLTESLFRIKNKYLSTLTVVLVAYSLTNNYKKIWPMFGAANQLIAALVLLAISAYLLSKNRKTVYTLVPAVIMIVTVGGALIWKIKVFMSEDNYMLSIIAIILFILAAYMAFATTNYFLRYSRESYQKMKKESI
ncbi:MAG: carbon starvation protein A [Elusimicrobiota bacterium]